MEVQGPEFFGREARIMTHEKITGVMIYYYFICKRKHILINGEINIDFIKRAGVIHEIKKSKKMEEASIWQVKYYLFYLKNYGIDNIKAKIDYPLLKQVVEVNLQEEDETKLRMVLAEVNQLIKMERMPLGINNKKLGKKCVFFDLCMI